MFFVPSYLTAEGSFTSGIEGAVVDSNGIPYACDSSTMESANLARIDPVSGAVEVVFEFPPGGGCVGGRFREPFEGEYAGLKGERSKGKRNLLLMNNIAPALVLKASHAMSLWSDLLLTDYKHHTLISVDTTSPASGAWSGKTVLQGAFTQPNDLAMTPNGRFVFLSDPDFLASRGRIWRAEWDPRSGAFMNLQVVAEEGLTTANGIEVIDHPRSQGGNGWTLVASESKAQLIRRWTIDEVSGDLSTPQVLLNMSTAIPPFDFDGMRATTDGVLYVTMNAGGGRVLAVTYAGSILCEIDALGLGPSNIAFGGNDGRTAFVTQVKGGRMVQFRVPAEGSSFARMHQRPSWNQETLASRGQRKWMDCRTKVDQIYSKQVA